MNYQILLTVVLSIILSCYFLGASAEFASISCTSCGEECADACGTRHFRTCCFNYLRKRSSPTSAHHVATTAIANQPDIRHSKLWILTPQMEKLLNLNQVEEPKKSNDLVASHQGFKYQSSTLGDDQPEFFYNIPT